MARFKRKDLKRPDPFISTTRRAILWGAENRRQVWIAGGVAAAVVIAIASVVAVRAARVRQANQELAQGLAQLHGDHYVEAAVELNDAGVRWSGTTPGTIAMLYATQASLLASNKDGAAATAQKVTEEGGEPTFLNQQAVLTLAFLSEDQGDYAKAAERYAKARMIKGPYVGIALLGEGRCRDRLGEPAAVELYQSFLDEYPQSKDQAFVAARLGQLKAS